MASVVLYKDVNTLVGVDNNNILVTNINAINNSLYNIFTCPVLSRPELPEFGSRLWHLLQEPRDEKTAQNIRMSLTQSLRWEPRIQLHQMVVNTLKMGDGYFISVYYYIPKLQTSATFSMTASVTRG